MPVKARKSTLSKSLQSSRPLMRVRSKDEYHSWRWTKGSKAFRLAHPLCEECKRNGVIKEGELVDHIVPVTVCEDFWDQDNWQTLCSNCNIVKGNKDKGLIQQYRER